MPSYDRPFRPRSGLLAALVLIGLTHIAAAQSASSVPPGASFRLGRAEALHMTLSAEFTAPRDGEPANLFVTARLEPGWYTYSLTQPPPSIPTKIELDPSASYRLAGKFQPLTPPKVKNEKIGKKTFVTEAHHETVTWHAPLELMPGADPRSIKIAGVVTAQRCNENSCLPPAKFPFVAAIGPGVPGVRSNPSLASPPPSPDVSQGPAGFDAGALRENAVYQSEQRSFLGAIALGFLGGLLLNLMPCVLPVIGLKVLSFFEQAGKNRRTSLVLNVWYSLGLLSVFWLLALLAIGLNLGWGQQFQSSGFNVFLTAIVFTMALSFLGVWEFPIPGFIGRGSTAALAEQEGIVGAFSKGVITTVLATPCTGPFMGSALTWALNQSPGVVLAIFTSIGLGMASPYLVIGLFPELLRFLPRPGAWMDTFKQIMGFVLLGTVVYIFTFLQISYVVPAIGLLFSLWAACWWIARTPLTADFPAKARAWAEAAAFVGLMWILLFPGIDEMIPRALADRGVRGFAGLQDVIQARLTDEDEFWQPFTSRQELQRMINSNHTVLVDFTADWCLTCKTLEATVLSSSPIRLAIQENRVVPLKADWTRYDPEVTAMLELLGAKQVPVLAIFPAGKPNQPVALVGGYTQQMVLDALKRAGPSIPANAAIAQRSPPPHKNHPSAVPAHLVPTGTSPSPTPVRLARALPSG